MRKKTSLKGAYGTLNAYTLNASGIEHERNALKRNFLKPYATSIVTKFSCFLDVKWIRIVSIMS